MITNISTANRDGRSARIIGTLGAIVAAITIIAGPATAGEGSLLRCRARLAARDAALTACRTVCTEHGQTDAERGSQCTAACERKYHRSVAKLPCTRGGPSSDEHVLCGELHHPVLANTASGACVPGLTPARNATRKTMQGLVPTPDGYQERTLDVVDGLAILEGDIIVGRVEDVKKPGDPVDEAAGRALSVSRWPGGVVPYKIDSKLPNQERVLQAIAHWEANTPIRFVKRTTEIAYVTFKKGTGCSSMVGKQGLQQQIILAEGCGLGATIHEIGHAVGLYHEQSRVDRDAFIKINLANVEKGKASNFKTYREQGMDGKDIGGFDFGSIMLYGSYSFSKNGQPTITRRDGSTFDGQRTGLSTGDRNAIRLMYAAGTVSKPSYGRGVGSVPGSCPAGWERNGALCYPACASGYYGVGPVCWQRCPAGYADDGATCRRDAHIFSADNSQCPWYDACGNTFAQGCAQCPAGYTKDVCTCRRDVHIFGKASYGRGVGSGLTCRAGLQYDAGLCYQPCAAGYRNVGPTCLQNCPAGWTDDGATCRRGGVTIVGKASYGRGGGSGFQCAADKEPSNSLCYDPCPEGFYGQGPVCWAESCPVDYTNRPQTCECQ